MAFRKSGKLAAAQAVTIAAAVLFAVAAPRFINVMAVAENWASDLRVTFFNPPARAQNDIVVLAITEDTLALLPYRSPIDRGFLAGVLKDLKAAGARAVGIDILFDQPTEPKKDQAFLDAVKSMGVPVVVGWTDVETGLTESQYEFQKVYLKDVAAGYSNLFKDTVDGTVRNLFPGRENDGKYRLGFASMLAEALGHEPPAQSIRIDYRGRPDAETPAFPTFPIHAMKALPQAWFAGKVVMIGADLPFGDRHRTPFAAGLGVARGTFSGVAIQSNILSQIMEGRTAKGTNVIIEILIAVGLAGIASLLVFTEQPAAAKYAEGLITLTVFWVGAVWAFTEFRLNLPMVSPTIAFGAALGLGSAYAARLQKAEREFIHGAFSHYVSPAMVERMAENPDSLKLGGEQRELTLLFCDVRGFTTISEQFDAVGLTSLINKLLTPLTNVILSNQGTVDKYMGDCIMAFWNAPLDDENHALNGCISALKMLAEMKPLNDRLEQEAKEEGRKHIELKVGLGLNTGECVVGNMGSDQRFDYSVLGDTVNLAARLEGQSKAYGVDIVIGETTHAEAPELAAIELDLIKVKGKTEAVHIYALLGDETVAGTKDFQALESVNSDMLAAYRAQKWEKARTLANWARERGAPYRLDHLYDLYQERIKSFEAAPPPADWGGFFVATTK